MTCDGSRVNIAARSDHHRASSSGTHAASRPHQCLSTASHLCNLAPSLTAFTHPLTAAPAQVYAGTPASSSLASPRIVAESCKRVPADQKPGKAERPQESVFGRQVPGRARKRPAGAVQDAQSVQSEGNRIKGWTTEISPHQARPYATIDPRAATPFTHHPHNARSLATVGRPPPTRPSVT